MAVDPNISLGVGQGVQPLQNPLTTAGQYIGLANELQRNQLMGQEMGLMGTETAQHQQALALTSQNRIAQQTASLLMLPDQQLTPDAVNVVLARELASGTINEQQANAYRENVANTKNPQDLRALLTQHLVGTLAPPEQAAAIFGQNVNMNLGGQLMQGVQRSPIMGGGVAPTTSEPLTMTPEASAQQQITYQGGQPGTVPLSSLVTPTGQARGGGRMGPGTYPGGPGAPPGVNPTGPATGAAEGLVANQQAYRQAMSDVPNANQRLANLAKAEQALQLTSTGKGTAQMHQIYSFLTSQGLAPPGMQDNVENYDLAVKYLTDYARRNTTGPTNEQLDTALKSNASTDIANKAALDVVRTNVGRERQQLAATMGYTSMPTTKANGGADWLNYNGAFNSNTDRRAFSADMVPPAELQAMVAKMSPAERLKFGQSLKIAKRMGMLNLGGQAPQQ